MHGSGRGFAAPLPGEAGIVPMARLLQPEHSGALIPTSLSGTPARAFTVKLGVDPDLSRALDHILRDALEVFASIDADFAAIFRVDRRGEELRLTAARHAYRTADSITTQDAGIYASHVLNGITSNAAMRDGSWNWHGTSFADPQSDTLGVFALHGRTAVRLTSQQRLLIDHFARHVAARLATCRVQRRLRLANALAKRAQRRLEHSSCQKDELIAVLSHELRQPLSAAMPALEAQKHSLTPEGRQRAVEVVEKQLRQLSTLVEDLSTHSHMTHGFLSLKREPADMCRLVTDVVETMSERLTANGHHIDVKLDLQPAWVYVDTARMTQVLSNLLQNADAYTPTGGRIRASLGKDGDCVECRIADTGVGIAPQMLQRIWEPFQRGSSASSTQSYGVGLAVVRRLVELQGGTVAAASDGPDRGSQFIVRLPLYTPTDRRPTIDESH